MMHNPFSLQRKTILVTGASSGIGRAIAVECSMMGAKVLITGRNEKRLNETLEKLEGNMHSAIVADLQIQDDIKLLVNQIEELDGLVHSAGIVDMVPFQFVTKEKLENTFKINFYGAALLSKELAQRKLLKKGSSIVFISSITGVYCTFVANTMYGASKGAINGLVKGMALDLAARSIRVNSLNPGMIDTKIIEQGLITTEQYEQDQKRYPLKRYGKPEEIAYAAIYLLSDASSYVTGSNLLIDGGYTLI